MAASIGMTALLVARVRESTCALPVSDVIETMRPLPIRPLPQLPPFVMGLAVIRGATVPVVNLGSLFGLEGVTAIARIVTLRAGKRIIAAAVEDVVGIRYLDDEVLGSLPPLLSVGSSDVVSQLGVLDRDLLVVLRSARLVPEDVWAQLETKAASP
jgi:purine-binding chemotaxis protein CheW